MFFSWNVCFQKSRFVSHPSSGCVGESTDVRQATVCPFEAHYRYYHPEKMVLIQHFKHNCHYFVFNTESNASSLFLHGLQSQLSVEIRCLVQGGHIGALLHFTESNVGPAVGAQNDLQWPKKKSLVQLIMLVVSM